MSENSSTSSGLSLSTVLLVVFLVLKLAGLVAWPWLWVLAPLWIPVGISIAVGVVLLIGLAASKAFS